MQPEQPLLTLAIPTYNRSGCLAKLLEVLEPQLAQEARVELLISDNCSPDETPSIVKSFQDRGLSITYSRNQTNIGADANFVRCYEMAHGEYVWIFGDDDIIVPGGLQEVLGRLESREFDLLYLRAKGFRDRYDPCTAPKKFSHKLKVFSRPEDFALYAHANLTFISGNIVRKAALECLPHQDFKKQIGTNLVQLSWTLSMLAANPKCACLLDPLIANRMDNSGGHGTCQVFGANLHAIVAEFLGVGSPMGRAILNRTVQSFFPWAMLHSRKGDGSRHFQEDSLGILKGLYHDNPRYWLFLHPVFKLPLSAASLWVIAGKVINRLDQVVGYPIARTR